MSRFAAFLALTCGAACGNTSSPAIERVQPPMPPEFTQRVDVFLVGAAASCAIGAACTSAQQSNCFSVSGSAGTTYFDPSTLEFVPAGDARIATAAQSACFSLELDESDRAAASQAFSELRTDVFQLSGGAIDLDVRVHLVEPSKADFKRWEGGSGLFFQPTSLDNVGLPLMSRDSDFVFAITGEHSGALATLPKIDPCGGTNWQAQGALGGAAYTWLSTSCVARDGVLWHFLYQSYFAMRDVVGFEDLYAQAYPACGQGAADRKRWFPRPSDCLLDPDAASCGGRGCDQLSFAAHVLTTHWPSQPGLIGNHCRNGRADYDETAVDSGGVCDALGH